MGNEALMVKYPSLYQIVRKKQVSVASVLQSIPLNISFRRALTGNGWNCGESWFDKFVMFP
jgi:hypothetical protein